MAESYSTPLVTLTTDFGTTDHYAGVLKGLILGICPNATVVDISHEVAPFQIAQGGFLLAQAWPWFRNGSVHVAVVDPGVGGRRRALVAEANGSRFILPDNGLLSLIGVTSPIVREIRNQNWMLHPVSRTFHGRDIFAPAAAHLAKGARFDEAGPLVEDWTQLAPAGDSVLHIDRFGNVITSLRTSDYDLEHAHRWDLRIGSSIIDRFFSNYAAANHGELFVIAGSSGYLEVSARAASAAAKIGCRVGDPATLQLAGKS